MPTARFEPAVGVLNDVLYAVGGTLFINGNGDLTTVEAYSAASNTWSTKAPLPSTGRGGASAGVVNGLLYVVGGYNGRGMISVVEAYNAATDSWSTKASIPTPRQELGIGVVNGILYAVAGYNPSLGILSTVEAYDPTTNTWSAKAPLPTARIGPRVGILNGILYVVGGEISTSGIAVATVEAYDPTSDTWSTKAPMNTPRDLPAVGVINGILYAAGGWTNLHASVLNTVEAYDPATNSWTSVASMPTGLVGAGAGIVQGVLYAVGGGDGTTAGAANEAFTPGSTSLPALTWQQTLSGTADVWSIAINSAGNVFAATGSGVYRSMDNGGTWTLIDAPAISGATPSALAINQANGYVFLGRSDGGAPPGIPGAAGGGGSGLYRSTDNGATWTYWNVGNPGVFGIGITASGSVLAASSSGLFRSTDNGASWAAASCCYPRSFANTSNGNVFAGETYSSVGGIFRSTNGGTNWTQVGLATTPVYSVVATSSDHLFAGTPSTGIFRSTDGVTWTNINALTNPVTSLAVNSASLVFAGVYGNGVVGSGDDGGSWSPLNNGLTDLRVESLSSGSSSGYIFAGTPSGVFRALQSSAAPAPPVANAGGPYTGYEGAAVTFNGTGSSDPGGHALSYSWNFGDGSALGTGATPSHTYLDNGTYTVTLTVSNGTSSSTPATTTATIANVAPTVGATTAPVAPVPVNTTITASASFTDPGTLDTHTALFAWGDGSSSPATVTETNGSGSVSGSHIYSAAGVYTVTLTVTDKDAGTGQSFFEFVVVYDPAAGFVTGNGSINSPAGAYAADPTLTGRANFGFVSRYQKGATVPTGNTQFQFQAGNLHFKSTSYDWLVISGPQAKYKGSGTINGAGDFAFLLSAVDGAVSGGGGTDKFRIKIWDKGTGAIIYDNQLGATDDAAATTVIVSGDIVIHN